MNTHDRANQEQIALLRAGLQENAEVLRELADRAEGAGDTPEGRALRAAVASQRQARLEALEATPRGAVVQPALAPTPCGCGRPRTGALCDDCAGRY